MVFYQKYRPQTLDEIVGQSVVKEALKASIQAGKLSHAYLFCGPRGTGKTSTARILAKIINCLAKQNRPCNMCEMCLSITDGSNLDVIEIDAASNRGIDDVRSLRENIKLSSAKARKKVYIIDEVHMLSTDAFNALLKTLEEPPEHVVFILATTEAQKIPATILSRVQRLDFQLALVEDIVAYLERIVKGEKIEIGEEALLSLAKKAGGSFRDGAKFLDQLSSFGKVNQKIVEQHFNLGDRQDLYKLLEDIALQNSQAALLKLVALNKAGINPKELALSLLEALRQVLFIKNNLGEIIKKEFGKDSYQELVSLADKFEMEIVTSALELLQKSLEQARFVSIPTLPLELAVIESCKTRVSENSDKSEKLTSQQVNKSDSEASTHRSAEAPTSSDTPTHQKNETPIHRDPNLPNSDIQKIKDKWTYILETVRAYNFSLEALLRSAKILSCENKSIVFEVPYSFHQRILEAPKSKDILESILADVLGRVVIVSTTLGKRPILDEEVANIEVAADDDMLQLAAEIFNSDTVN